VDELAESHRRGKRCVKNSKKRSQKNQGKCRPGNLVSSMLLNIVLLQSYCGGWLENTSCQLGERAHNELLKCFAGIQNNREVFRQFLIYWERSKQLSRVQNQDNHIVEELENNKVSDEDAREESMHSGELGVCCPLFFMTANRHDQHYRAVDWAGAGPECCYKVQRSVCGRQAFNVWAMT